MGIIKFNPEQELEYIILRGYCPYCRSKKMKYHETSKNHQFEFYCLSCGWHNQYNREQFLCLSHSWSAKNKIPRGHR